MLPIDEARALCASLGYNFDQLRTEFDREGYSYAGQDCVILAKVVNDCWWVWLAVGHNALYRFFALAPFCLPNVAFAREAKGRCETKVYSYSRIQTLAQHGRQTSSTCSTSSTAASRHGEK